VPAIATLGAWRYFARLNAEHSPTALFQLRNGNMVSSEHRMQFMRTVTLQPRHLSPAMRVVRFVTLLVVTPIFLSIAIRGFAFVNNRSVMCSVLMVNVMHMVQFATIAYLDMKYLTNVREPDTPARIPTNAA